MSGIPVEEPTVLLRKKGSASPTSWERASMGRSRAPATSAGRRRRHRIDDVGDEQEIPPPPMAWK
jgi:hypothetical protein